MLLPWISWAWYAVDDGRPVSCYIPQTKDGIYVLGSRRLPPWQPGMQDNSKPVFQSVKKTHKWWVSKYSTSRLIDISVDGRLTIKIRTDIGSYWESANNGGLSFPKNDLALDIKKMKIRCQDQWLYSVPCVHNLGLTFCKIGESMKIGMFIDISIEWLLTHYFSKILFMWGFMIDGNFQAEHMKMRNPENDISLSEGTGFMVSQKPYQLHLQLAFERCPAHGHFCW